MAQARFERRRELIVYQQVVFKAQVAAHGLPIMLGVVQHRRRGKAVHVVFNRQLLGGVHFGLYIIVMYTRRGRIVYIEVIDVPEVAVDQTIVAIEVMALAIVGILFVGLVIARAGVYTHV